MAPPRYRETEKQRGSSTRKPKIRCPKCAWQPRRHDRWQCECRHVWNTFDTRGVCPACDKKWAETQCFGCHRWSPHDAWYVDEPGGR
jgi:hypothetical protein